MENPFVQTSKEVLAEFLEQGMQYHETDNEGLPVAAFSLLTELEMQMENELNGLEFKLVQINEKYLAVYPVDVSVQAIFFEVEHEANNTAYYRLTPKDIL